MPPNLSDLDQEFLRLKAGDVKAYEKIYATYAKSLIKLAFYKTSNKMAAEELVQNIFVSLWENKEKLLVADGKSYLFGALKFAVINYYRALSVKQKHEIDLQRESTNQNETLNHLEEKELDRKIKSAISMLPNKTQEIFKMSRYQHQTNKEISKQLNISEKTVEYHITQSLKWLNNFLKKAF